MAKFANYLLKYFFIKKKINYRIILRIINKYNIQHFLRDTFVFNSQC